MMLGTKVSQFIKNRYVLDYDDLDTVGPKDFIKENISASAKSAQTKENAEEEFFEIDQDLLDYEKSNQGRTYGWWVCIDGKRVATLDYRCLLNDAVHLYIVNVLDDKFSTIDLDPEKWLGINVTIQSRFAEAYSRKGLIMAPLGQQKIAAEDLIIPEDHFRKESQKLIQFHNKLIEKAKDNAKK